MLEPYHSYDSIDPSHIKMWFEKHYGYIDHREVFGSNSSYNKGKTTGRDFLDQAGIGDVPKVLLNGFLLDDDGVTGEKFEETLMLEVMHITQDLQKAVIRGDLHDRSNVGDWVMEQKHVVPRYNKRILETLSKKNVLDFADVSDCKGSSLSDFMGLTRSEKIQCITTKMTYIKKTDENETMPLTLWVVADPDSEHGRQIVYNTVRFIKHDRRTRVSCK
ncbi:hypothetical protein COOONC_28014 [Cooperia oncophora]